MPTDTCPLCGAPEGCRTGVYYSGKWRDRRSIDCYERQIKNLTEQLAAKDAELRGEMAANCMKRMELRCERDAATAELARLREFIEVTRDVCEAEPLHPMADMAVRKLLNRLEGEVLNEK